MGFRGNTKAPTKMAKVYRHRLGILWKRIKRIFEKYLTLFEKEQKVDIFWPPLILLPGCLFQVFFAFQVLLHTFSIFWNGFELFTEVHSYLKFSLSMMSLWYIFHYKLNGSLCMTFLNKDNSFLMDLFFLCCIYHKFQRGISEYFVWTQIKLLLVQI